MIKFGGNPEESKKAGMAEEERVRRICRDRGIKTKEPSPEEDCGGGLTDLFVWSARLLLWVPIQISRFAKSKRARRKMRKKGVFPLDTVRRSDEEIGDILKGM